ncbi:pentapeptide repeat-containing protein [Streptomyces sp. 3MP-14]|uniref:Pentapeptide repeat-containing protein n=1 Tax=Streptomyces mimosae TaxID=2586635 RepID=A0A5N6AGD2_9ACTN|nr:pentapeptide repeat-containing protein [Streptomyces mimosae]KAB8177248.1 pentapeptide repeat-containing protein [Streptomyces sp. 3MP-14]
MGGMASGVGSRGASGVGSGSDRRSDAVRGPQRPQLALPEEPEVFAETARLAAEEDYDGVEFVSRDLSGARAPGATFLDCALRGCVLDEAVLKGARLLDSLLAEVRGVGVDLMDAELRDVEISDARLGGAQCGGASLTRVLVRGGKIDYLNLRQARLVDVVFEGCVLVEPDFGGARLERVSFDDCELRGPDLTGATLRDVDLRAVSAFEPGRGIDRLAGAVISPAQLVELAPLLAAQLGVRVLPRG